MQFLNPILLSAGLACIAVPILIHILMRRRRRPIRWGAMEFLLQAYQQQRQRLRFEQWLLLGSRCLLVALLALAIGKPVLSALGGSGTRRAKDLILVLDNSLTSQALDAGDSTTALARHKAQATALLATLDASRGDRAGLVLLGGPAEAVVLPASSDLADVRRRVERATPTDSRTDLAGALGELGTSLTRQREEKPGENQELVLALLSDWRTGSVDTTRALAAVPALRDAQLLLAPPASATLANIAITSVRPLRPVLVGQAGESGAPDAGTLPVRVELQRSTSEPAVTTLRAEVRTAPPASDPARVTSTTIAWGQGQTTASATLSLRTPAHAQEGSRELLVVASVDRDPIAGDNTAASTIMQRAALVATIVRDDADTSSSPATSIDTFTASDWMALALDPAGSRDAWGSSQGSAGVRVQRADVRDLVAMGSAREGPGEALPAALRDTSVLIITRPDTLDAAAWRGVRTFLLRGGLALITPPDASLTHLWSDAMEQSLGLGLELSREAIDRTGADGTGVLVRTGEESAAKGEDLLAMLRGELPELAKAVRVRKALGVTKTGPDVATLLTLEDGSPLLLGARVRDAGTPRGWAVVWTAAPALSWTDLPAKPLMVPLMQELVRQGALAAGGGDRRELVAGTTTTSTTADASSWVREVAWREDASDAATQGVQRTGPTLREAGVWTARSDAGQRLTTLLVQADTSASDTSPVSPTALEGWIAGLGAREVRTLGGGTNPDAAPSALASRTSTPPLSVPLLIAAALVALLEVLLARWFSHAKAEGAARARNEGEATGA